MNAQRRLFDSTEDFIIHDEEALLLQRYVEFWKNRDETNTPVVLSYSGGTSSEWCLHAVIRGIIPRPPYFAVAMADTGEEHAWTYDRAAYVMEVCQKEGITFLGCADNQESLGEHLLNKKGTRMDQPPIFFDTGNASPGRAANRCTGRWKIAPMRRAVSRWLKDLRQPKRVIKWIGFGFDEQWRANKTIAKMHRDVLWETCRFPVIKAGKSRAEQRADLIRWTGKAPLFSMCILCPHKNEERWNQTPKTQIKRVYEIDEAIRDLDEQGFDGTGYLTAELIPVSHLLAGKRRQLRFPGMDAGCDGGHCMV